MSEGYNEVVIIWFWYLKKQFLGMILELHTVLDIYIYLVEYDCGKKKTLKSSFNWITFFLFIISDKDFGKYEIISPVCFNSGLGT